MTACTPALRRWRAPFRRGLLATLLLATGSAGAADWKRFETDHFTVYTRARAVNAEEFATRLEMLHWLTLRLVVSRATATSPVATRRTEVYMTERETLGLGPVTHQDEGAIRGSLGRGSTFDCLRVTGLSKDSIRARLGRDLQLIQELVAIQLLSLHAPMAFPDWWHARGFARYLAATDYVNGELLLGDVDSSGAATLETSGKWLPWETVLRLEPAAQTSPSLDMEKFQAQAWWLVHRLMSSAQGKQTLAGYLERRASGEDPVAALEAASGRSIDEWDRSLWADFHGTIRLGRVRPELLPKVTVRRAEIDPQLERYLELRADLHCPGPQRGAQLRQRLHEAVADAGPEGPALTRELALADLHAGDPGAAIARLEPLVRSDPQDAEAHRLLAGAWRRSAATLPEERRREPIDRAADHAERAVQLLPQSAAAWREYAQVLDQLQRPAETLQALARAHAIEPPQLADTLLEAKHAMATGDRQRAVQALEVYAYQTWWPSVSRDFRAGIAAIRAGRSPEEIQALITPKPAAKP